MKKMLLFLLLLPAISFANISCRNPEVKRIFDKTHGYPKGRAGYVVDHICPLDCGGLDIQENLQYQTIAAGKAKDKWETSQQGCKSLCNKSNSLPIRTVFNCK